MPKFSGLPAQDPTPAQVPTQAALGGGNTESLPSTSVARPHMELRPPKAVTVGAPESHPGGSACSMGRSRPGSHCVQGTAKRRRGRGPEGARDAHSDSGGPGGWLPGPCTKLRARGPCTAFRGLAGARAAGTRGQEGKKNGRSKSVCQHPTPYTLRPTPYALHPPPYTLHPPPYTLLLDPVAAAQNFK